MATSWQMLVDRLELADELLLGKDRMPAPQDLPGRYGCVVCSVDRVLQSMQREAAVACGWAVWRHGFLGRVTQDLDTDLPADRIDEFLRVAALSGFEVLAAVPGRWPKLHHKEADVQVDILPEGAWPGRPTKLAPTTIPHPAKLAPKGTSGALDYVTLPALVELKLAAGRARDEFDVVELIRANPEHVQAIREHLAAVHSEYVATFDLLTTRAQEQEEAGDN